MRFLLYCCCCRQRDETPVRGRGSLERQFLQLEENDPLTWNILIRDSSSEESHGVSHFLISSPSAVDCKKKKSVKFSMLNPMDPNLHLHNEPGASVKGISKDSSGGDGKHTSQV
ncbi:hypothetical protein LSM04_000155 [Trypanosoma melophagium]|uniref:uncharacterized protein n=1 Tax=Trypanosoma melophagium TaxID=715481 RepID=UPI00351A17E2|nr:hypothetical protein LSM04_000155 [Trypanosoma melophagium]